MKIILLLICICIFTSCSVYTTNSGVDYSYQSAPIIQPVVYTPVPVVRNNFWYRPIYPSFWYGSAYRVYRPAVRVNINPPRRHWNGPRGGRRR